MSDKETTPILPPLNGGGGNNGGSSGGTPQQTVNLQQVLASAQGLNVLTTGAGQQFVITSQVPGLTQVLPNNATTNASIQQVGVTRIVNISGTPPCTSVGIAGASSSPLASPNRQVSPKVVLATSPKLVRTSIGNIFVAPTSQASMQSPPARKKLKLADSTDVPTMIADDAMSYTRRIMEHKMKRMRAIREKYAENASELFFLHAGGNMMDYQTWRKRPPTPQYLHFLRQHRLDPEDDDEDLTAPLPAITEIPLTPSTTPTTVSTIVPVSQCAEVKITVAPVAVSTTLPAAVAQLSQQGNAPIVTSSPKSVTTVASPVTDKPSTIATTVTTTVTTMTTPTLTLTETITTTTNTTVTTVTTTTATTKASSMPILSTQPVVKLVKLPASTATTTCDTTNNQEQIVEKAKQEAYVMQRIAELQREGLWSERRLPKVQEPARTKAHWDYLLEEMVWLAADFAQERKWKKAAAKKCARMVQKYFQEKAIQAQKAEKSQELRLKKIAGFIAKEIKTFWTNVEKLVEYKQQTRLEEKRKQALDQHLNFIVGQTEKYSTWLTEGLNKTEGSQSIPASINSSRISSPIPPGKSHSDEDFQPNQSSDDDEETIAKAEEELKSVTNHKEEVELLKKESEIPLEDLLKELPPDYLENRSKSLSPMSKEIKEEEIEKAADGDMDFVAASDESSDEEETIMEQEKLEANTDYKQELDDLKAENEMSIDQLMAKYGNVGDVPMDVEQESTQDFDKESAKEEEGQENDEESTDDESESEESDNEVEDESQTQSDNEADIGLKSLLEDISMEKSTDDKAGEIDHSNARDEMDNVAALAESIQPKGNTLLTTSVVTKIPFLLKHSLREYQHIGLDWLVTMYDRKLNGILADEMGLGKTIQTIALLAHLACEKGNWGPHLIIVPTSVMLNWEMECKKWCPGFKILTYYGTQKERKQKRTGWTKPNAFHICITSYKLVIQDHQSFRRKKWKYLILDEAQNIKNFKSQRWQLLLNFQTQRRLLLTGTPLQNNLMELWSLMHFLMPNVFQSHREFKEWFSNPVTGMIEGNSEYNENIIRRLHKVLRPFLLRRLKTEVEKQLPKKYEHVVMCRLSKRQRYLYDDFMSRAKTKETLASGNLLSVINVLMQLRKVCNHPNLFEVRPTISPFQMEAIEFVTASLVWGALDYDPFKHIDLSSINLFLCDLDLTLTAFVAHRVRRLQTPRKLIEEIDSQPEPPPRCPPGKIKINVRLSNQARPSSIQQQTQAKFKNLAGILPTPKVGTSPLIKTANNQSAPRQGVTLKVASGQLQGYPVQLVQHQGSVKVSFPVMSGQRLTVLSKSLMGLSTSAATVNKVIGGVVTTSSGTSGRPVMRVPPLNVTASQAQSPTGNGQPQQQQSIRCGIVTRHAQKDTEKAQTKERPKSEFYLPQLEEERKQRREAKLELLANINERRCAACPLYGEDLFMALRIGKPSTACRWHNGWVHCATTKNSTRTRKQFFSRTEALAEAIKSTEQIVEELKEVFERFVVHVPAVCAPTPRFHVSHPPPHKLFGQRRMQMELQRQLSPKLALFHPVASATMTQFPDPRLIQYDCGKLQSLDQVLRKLKSENHRVLIFTQMTRMLDVLEAFLNYHGHIYLRLDGTTRVDQRQVLMERFNGDKRIFCFILSTRSGGVGVNLTGADTVIFYDSDWNPTMDAQAQDRCHRIGQTRDVHIYRLVSEKTVEENILKKANQKRLLGDLAIEGGNFTTAYFKSSTIQDLFNIDQSENDASTRMAEVLEQNRDREKFLQKDGQGSSVEDKIAMGALESALAAAEEDLDVQAAKTAKAEAVADLAEFDENIPLDDADKDDTQVSKAELEVQNLVSQLTPIERYAMKFVEESEGAFSSAQLAAAERELEEQKKEWELDRLRALREEEERRMRLADDDEKPLTFGREDAQNQVNSASNSKKLVNKKLPPNRRRNSRKNISKSAQESESDTDTTTESESESQEDVVEDSLDEESSHTESQSQGDEDEEEEEMNDQNDSEKGEYPKRKNRSNKSFSQNHFDLNSPRTRSRGNVKINLWTLDVSPILPGIKPKCRGRASNLRKQRELEMRIKAQGKRFVPPGLSCRKFNITNSSSKSDDEDSTTQKEVSDTEQMAIDKEENCKMVQNHAKSVRDSLDMETCSQSDNSSVTSEQYKDSESSLVDEKVCDDVSQDNPEQYSNSEPETNSNDESENFSIDSASQNSNSNSPAIQSNSSKHTSDSKCLKNSITLDIDEEISISGNSTITPLKNKMTVQDNVETNSIEEKEESCESRTSENNYSIVDELQDNSVSDDERTRTDARPHSAVDTKKKTTVEETPVNEEQYDESTLGLQDQSPSEKESKSVIGSSSSQESNISEQNCTKSDECTRDEDKGNIQSTSKTSDNTSCSNTTSSNSSETSETKDKFRKPSLVSYGVITRSAKLNLSIGNTENKNSSAHSSNESSESRQNQENEASHPTTPRKEISKTRRPDTPRPTAECSSSRVTRSSAVRSFTPPPSSNASFSKTKRPDTPMPECFKASSRPTTRSMPCILPQPSNEEQNTCEKRTTRSSKTLDNGFMSPPPPFKRSSSIPPTKPSSETKDFAVPVTTRSKRNSESSNINTNPRRRPDTPVPTFEQVSRVTRSGLNFTLNSGKSNHVSRSNKNARKSDSSSDPKTQVEEASNLNTDSNGNAVVSETFAKQEDTALSLYNDERPQRTAKVVAILTLDTRNNHVSKASSSVHSKSSNCNSTDAKNTKKNADSNSNTASDSTGKNCLRISDVTSNCKVDRWCESGVDIDSSNVLSKVVRTYSNTKKPGKASPLNKSATLNANHKTDKVPLPVQSAVIALVDLDNDPNYDSSDGSQRLRRKLKRTRLSSFTKSLKEDEPQVNALDDEEQIPPKKSVRSQLPPPPSSQSMQLEKINSGSIS
ncbi:helicase domino isoform X2 [Ceratina calcarata]|uniref:Helicase domino isoform X2 n=1 Tax=Ceratina calcarata TaxID=156304 RepID=A0AAJ7NAI7_9HYME|nr:helicase domino isoform X2 [Ceratina calcarata]